MVSLADGPAAAEAYVVHGLRRLETDPAEVRVTYLDAGIMNYVYRVEIPGRTLFLKQALPRVKQHDRLGPDLAGVSPARIQAEWRALALLAEALPPGLRGRVPAPVWYDEENNVLWTAEVAPGAVSLQQALQSGRCDARAAERLGRLLGAVHQVGSGAVSPIWPSRAEDRGNWERFLRMRTVGVLPRAELPPAAEALTRELHAEATRFEKEGMLSHLDAAPKNVLLDADGEVALLDFELGAAISDPAYDPGFLAGHYLLMGENLPAMRDAARGAAGALTRGYREAAPEVDAGWGQRVARYAGLTMLYRLCGSSPAPYLSEQRYGTIREAGLQLLMEAEW